MKKAAVLLMSIVTAFVMTAFGGGGSSSSSTISGTLDTSFCTEGVATYDGGSNDNNARSIVLDSSGNIYVAGWILNNNTSCDIVVLKYDSTGSLDSSFGTEGVATYDGETYDRPNSIALDSTAIYAAGYSGDSSSRDIILLKYN